ncbi:MAG: methyltransferase domain-containing protein, partial [Hyphomicrobiaceae bacterium]
MSDKNDLINHYKKIHETREYGTTSIKNLRYIRPEVALLAPLSIVDYGCGQSKLIDLLVMDRAVAKARYDPAIPEYATKPEKKFDLLITVDVLEHIEEADLNNTIHEMSSLCENAIIIIDTAPAVLFLPDGRNAHVSLHDRAWWAKRLSTHFPYLRPMKTARR